jgi:hypothetical protein
MLRWAAEKEEWMTTSTRVYVAVSGGVFLLVAVFHLLRLFNHWSIVVGTTTIPFALSYLGLPASIAYFAWACWLLARVGRAARS